MTSTAGDLVDVSGSAIGARHQCIDQGGFPDSGVADEDAHPIVQGSPQLGQIAAALRDHMGDPERSVDGQQCFGVGEVDFGQAEKRSDAGVKRSHERAIDQSGSWFGIGNGGHDHELGGVRDHDPFDRAVSSAVRRSTVVRGSTSTIRARLPDAPADVADHADAITHDDEALATELAELIAVTIVGSSPSRRIVKRPRRP